ncbi:MAG: hypothetical protein M1546_10890 [Chloroflexi bacterium]|nr:hypothetical protein [Chloroflexota bacterium]
MKRIVLGILGGFVVGAIVATLIQVYEQAPAGFRVVDLATVLAVGTLFGVPAGLIFAGATSQVDYRTGWGVEWALVGAVAALLFGALVRQFEPRPTLIMLGLLSATAFVVERATAIVCRDTGIEARPTGMTLAVYGGTAVALLIVYGGLFGIILSQVS